MNPFSSDQALDYCNKTASFHSTLRNAEIDLGTQVIACLQIYKLSYPGINIELSIEKYKNLKAGSDQNRLEHIFEHYVGTKKDMIPLQYPLFAYLGLPIDGTKSPEDHANILLDFLTNLVAMKYSNETLVYHRWNQEEQKLETSLTFWHIPTNIKCIVKKVKNDFQILTCYVSIKENNCRSLQFLIEGQCASTKFPLGVIPQLPPYAFRGKKPKPPIIEQIEPIVELSKKDIVQTPTVQQTLTKTTTQSKVSNPIPDTIVNLEAGNIFLKAIKDPSSFDWSIEQLQYLATIHQRLRLNVRNINKSKSIESKQNTKFANVIAGSLLNKLLHTKHGFKNYSIQLRIRFSKKSQKVKFLNIHSVNSVLELKQLMISRLETTEVNFLHIIQSSEVDLSVVVEGVEFVIPLPLILPKKQLEVLKNANFKIVIAPYMQQKPNDVMNVPNIEKLLLLKEASQYFREGKLPQGYIAK
jgi:hypothetical protein